MAEQMKPSGIDWIGDIPNNWETSRIKYHYQISLGKMLQPIQENSTDTLEHYMCSANITWAGVDTSILKQMWFSPAEKKQYRLLDGDLLVSEGGDVAVSCIWRNELDECYLQNAVHRVRQNALSDNRFIYYWLFFLKNYGIVDLICNKATIAHFTKEKFGELPICIMSIDEQVAIADFLDKECAQIDGIAADLEKQIVLLQQYKKSLITETVTKGLDKSVPMKDSGIEWVGKIPEHWNVTKIKYFCRMYSGENLTSADIEPDGDYPVYGGNGKRGYYSNFTNDGEHVLVGRQGALCGNVHLVSGKFWATDHAVVTYPTKEVINKYLYYLLRAMNLNQYSQSAAQPGLAVNIILALKTCLPSTLKEQETIVDFLDDKCLHVDQIILQKERQFSILQQHKKSLIYEYVTGKKRVKEVR